MSRLRSNSIVWHKIPLLRLLPTYASGLLVGMVVPHFYLGLAALFLVAILLATLFLKNRPQWYNTTVYHSVFFVLAYALTVLNTDRQRASHYSHWVEGGKVIAIGSISGKPIEKDKSVKAEVELELLAQAGDTHAVTGKVLCYFQKSKSAMALAHSDRIILNTRLDSIAKPANPGEFNYRRFLRLHQLDHRAFVDSASWSLASQGRGFVRMVHAWQQAMVKMLNTGGLSDDELGVASALLVGYTHLLTADLMQSYAATGALHVLSVSGLHVGIVYLILAFLLKPLASIRFGKPLKALLLFGALWGYAMLTGLSPSVVRSATMFSFVLAAHQFDRKSNILNTIAASALFLLIVNPYYIAEVGFQLSYLAVFGIVLLHPPLFALWQPRSLVLQKVWALISVSTVAQLATMPIALFYFHQFPTYFLVANVVAVPLSSLVLGLGLAYYALSWVVGLGWLLSVSLLWSVKLLNWVVNTIESWPISQITGVDIEVFSMALLYALITCGLTFLWLKHVRWLQATGICLALLIGAEMTEAAQQRNQLGAVIFSTPHHNVAEFVAGGHHQLLADSLFLADENTATKTLGGAWWQWDVLSQSENSILASQSGSHVFAGKIWVELDSTTTTLPTQADVVWIKRPFDEEMVQVLELPECTFVVGTALTWRQRGQWLHELEARNLKHWDLRTQGAFTAYAGSLEIDS